jgi:hypothetical protein
VQLFNRKRHSPSAETPVSPAEPYLRPIPDDLFFSEWITYPDGLKPSELSDFAALQIEALAPFPLHQLAWGYARWGEDSDQLWVYAALRERLRRDEPGWENHNGPVVPFGLLFNGISLPAGTAVVLQDPTGLRVLTFDHPGKPPSVHAYNPSVLQDETNPGQALRALLPEGIPEDQILFWKSDLVPVVRRGSSTLIFTEVSDADDDSVQVWKSRPYQGREIYGADVRSPETKEQARRQDRRELIVVRGLQSVAALLLLSLFLEGLNFIQTKRIESLERAIIAERPVVAELEDQHRLREQLSQLLSDEPGTFALLAHINEARDPAVHYNRVEFRSNLLVLEAETRSVEQVNQFVNRLRQTEGIRSVEINNQTTRVTGEVTFSLTLSGTVPSLADAVSGPQFESAGSTLSKSDEGRAL